MAWYDWFSAVYDASLEGYYAQARGAAVDALRLSPGQRLLDVPCGTGQSLPALCEGVTSEGRVLGLDLSAGMLRQARKRIDREGLPQARVERRAAQELSPADLTAWLGQVQVDRLHIFLGMSVFEDMEGTFQALWKQLAGGGRVVLVDVHNPSPGLQGHMVNLLARADIRRRFWEPLEAVCDGFERRELPYVPAHGGQIMLATGTKPQPSTEAADR